MSNEKQIAKLIDSRTIHFKNLHWSLKTAIIVSWAILVLWIAGFMIGYFGTVI